MILLGLSGAGFFSYLAWVTGDLAGVLRKAGWFTLAGILASLISGLMFFRAALRREFPVPVAKRVVRAITALFLAAFLLSEGSLLGRNDKSLDAENVLEKSRATLNEVNAELERIKSETDKITSTYQLESKTKQPNTIYAKTADNGLTLEYVIKVDMKQDEKLKNNQNPHTWVIGGKATARVNKDSGKEFAGHVTVDIASFKLDDALGGHPLSGHRTETARSDSFRFGDWALGGTVNYLCDDEDVQRISQRGFVVLAFMVRFKASEQDVEPHAILEEVQHQREMLPDWDERKAFIEKLAIGESGEFGGWHYLKLKSSVAKQAISAP
ncbi:MAG: hypothetical protein RIS70_2503 [Planctomycetota bacterium]